MAGIKIPGTAGSAEAMAARLSEAVRWHLNLAMPPPEQKVRPLVPATSASGCKQVGWRDCSFPMKQIGELCV